MTDTIIARSESHTPLVEIQSNPIGVMMQKMVDKGITTESALALEKMTDLYFKVEAENAKRAFATARCEMSNKLPRIVAKKPVPDANGNTKYCYAPFEEIMGQIGPYLSEYGFSISFSTRYEGSEGKDRIVAICKLSHVQGHSETNEFAVRISAPPKSSDAQADGATLTYAKRYALCLMLNISIDHDSDARIEGAVIPNEMAESLRERVKACGADEAKFLKLARSNSFEEIRTGVYAMLDWNLRRKEKENADEKAKADEASLWAAGATEKKR